MFDLGKQIESVRGEKRITRTGDADDFEVRVLKQGDLQDFKGFRDVEHSIRGARPILIDARAMRFTISASDIATACDRQVDSPGMMNGRSTKTRMLIVEGLAV